MKKVISVLHAPAGHWVGDGFPVRTIISPGRDGSKLTPFLLLDYAAPREFKPSDRPRGVEEHPHRGFETVTIVYQGGLEHRDSAGNSGRIGAGDVQWMTAASGVLHEEMHDREFTRNGGTFEVVQLWVNIPAQFKMSPPKYQELTAVRIPTVQLPDDAGSLRVIAGRFGGEKGPALTFTPINLWDLRLNPGKRASFALPAGQTAALFLLSGQVRVNDSETLGEAELAVLDPAGEEVSVEAIAGSKLLVLNGEPIHEPIASYGPFVMNTPEEIQQAIADYRAGRFGKLN